MTKNKNLLFLSDSDGTIFNTFKPCHNGYGVNEAYSQALLDIFGQEALDILRNHGLNNRAPGQVVELIFSEGEDIKDIFVQNAKLFFEKDERFLLEDLVPEDKGYKLEWSEGHLENLFTELLVRVKLSYLMNNIGTKNPDGTMWPEVFPGVIDFFETLKNYGDLGIISSGHDLFIKKSFELYNMECPEIMVTDDDLRIKSKSLISKPSPFLIHLALRQWGYGDIPPHESIIYTGDDIEKDGQMAVNAGVPFIYFDQKNESHWYELKRDLVMGNLPFI